MCDTILETIESDVRAERYRDQCNGSGLKLLEIIANELAKPKTRVATHHANKAKKILQDGLSAPTQAAFDQLCKDYEDAVMAKRLEELPEAELEKMMDDISKLDPK